MSSSFWAPEAMVQVPHNPPQTSGCYRVVVLEAKPQTSIYTSEVSNRCPLSCNAPKSLYPNNSSPKSLPIGIFNSSTFNSLIPTAMFFLFARSTLGSGLNSRLGIPWSRRSPLSWPAAARTPCQPQRQSWTSIHQFQLHSLIQVEFTRQKLLHSASSPQKNEVFEVSKWWKHKKHWKPRRLFRQSWKQSQSLEWPNDSAASCLAFSDPRPPAGPTKGCCLNGQALLAFKNKSMISAENWMIWSAILSKWIKMDHSFQLKQLVQEKKMNHIEVDQKVV